MISKINTSENNINIYIRLNKTNLKNMAILLLVIIMTIFLFVGGGSQQNHRLITDIWDAGHLVLFGLLSFWYFNQPERSRCSFIYKVIFTGTVSFFFGVVIEGLQLLIHRGFSFSDIINDVIGGYLGLLGLIVVNKQQVLSTRIIAVVVFIVFLVLGLRGLEKHLYDEFVMQKQFPVIVGFESQAEVGRWEFSGVNVNRSQQFVKFGKYSLEIEYLRGRYPNVLLRYLKADWSGYSQLMLLVYNPNYQSREFEIKIYDEKHIENGREYADRFNRNIVLKYGWNTINIAISDIISAPRERSMDVHRMKVISLFTDNLEKPISIYVDDIYLQ